MAFESLTDEKIKNLLEMPKRVKNPQARTVQDANHHKCDYTVEAIDGSEQFKIFVRVNNTNVEDFSCGLMWLPAGEETLILARYNGSSHEHPNHIEGNKIEFVCHIHKATERYIRSNLKPEGWAVETASYRTYDGALHQLVTDCHISGIETVADHPELELGSRPDLGPNDRNLTLEP